MKPVSDDLKAKLEGLGKPLHRYLRRDVTFGHLGFDTLLQSVLDHQLPFYLLVSKSPQATGLNLGHSVPLELTRYFQDVFDAPVVIQIGDDDKYVFTADGDIDKIAKLVKNTIKDVIAFGFKPEKTFVFINSEYIGELYFNVCHVEKQLTQKVIREAFGYTESDSVGMFALPTVKAAASFASSFPSIFKGHNLDEVPALVICGLDQAPFYTLASQVAPNIGKAKPAILFTEFVPSMQGLKTKMSGGEQHNSLLLTDSAADVKKKVNKYAFSGGGATLEDHKKNGGNTLIDVPYHYLRFFLEDDARLAEVRTRYSTGEMMTGEIKQAAIEAVEAEA